MELAMLPGSMIVFKSSDLGADQLVLGFPSSSRLIHTTNVLFGVLKVFFFSLTLTYSFTHVANV